MLFRSVLSCILVFLLTLHSTAIGFEGNSAPYRFERLGPYGGDVRALLVDSKQPDIFYLGSSNGRIFKSADAGHSWILLRPGIGQNGYVVDTLVQHPLDPDHLYAGAWDMHSDGGGLFESRDAGVSWDRMHLPQEYSAVRGFAVCRSDPARMIAGTLEGVFISADGGVTWNQSGGSLLQKAESVAVDPEDYRILYVGTWRLGYKSEDFGKTWKRLNNGMPLDSDVFSVAVNPRDPNIVYAGACSGVYRSGNRADTWRRLKVRGDTFTIRAHIMLVDPVVPHRIYAGTAEGLFVSDNDGASWKRLTGTEISVNAVQVDPDNSGRILIGTEYQGILRSEDAGRTWKDSNTGFIHQNISWIVPDPDAAGRFIGGVMSGKGGMLHFNSEARSWEMSSVRTGARIFSFLILPESQGRLAGTSQGVYWQASRSNAWKKLDGLIAERTIYSLELDFSAQVVYAGTDLGIYRASIDKLNFRLPTNSRLSPKVWSVLSPETAPDLVYAGTSLGLIRSWDKGTTWHVLSVSGLPERVMIHALAVSPSDKERLLAATSVGLYESNNGGVHWKRLGDGDMGVDIGSVLFLDVTGDVILAADKTSGGVFHSMDGGRNLGQNVFFHTGLACKLPFKRSRKSIPGFYGHPVRRYVSTVSPVIIITPLP